MPYLVYRGTINVVDGFGYAIEDIGSVAQVSSVSFVDSAGEPLPDGSLLNVYDGSFEIDALIAGPLMYQAIAPAVYGGYQWVLADTLETTLTVAVKTPAKKRATVTYSITVYR